MTQEEIKSGELSINEFMELPIRDDPRHGILYLCPVTKVYGKRMQYHSSWDWLIPVLISIRQKHNNYGVIKIMETSLLSLDIEKVFKEAIDTINWYNQNKK